jgi:hypothetical protein
MSTEAKAKTMVCEDGQHLAPPRLIRSVRVLHCEICGSTETKDDGDQDWIGMYRAAQNAKLSLETEVRAAREDKTKGLARLGQQVRELRGALEAIREVTRNG